MHQKISAEDTRDRPGSSETRYHHLSAVCGEERGGKHVGQRSKQCAHKIKHQITYVAQTILDVVSEDPEEEHVTADVRDTAVHKHRRKQRQVDGQRCYT